MIQDLLKLIKENQLLVGGLGVVGFGTIIGILWKAWYVIVRLFSYFCFVRLSFESVDHQNFRKVQYWLFNLEYTKKRCRSFNVRYVTKSKFSRKDQEDTQLFYPGYGNHYLFLYKRPSIINYNKADSKELQFRETIEISIFCLFGKAKITERLLADINKIYDEIDYTKTSVHACIDDYGSWTELLTKNIKQKPILSYDGEYQELVDKVNKFLESEDWYIQRGISYKLGILLAGVPGSGKSSTVLKLAQELKKHIYILNLASSAIDDAKFIELVSNLGKDAILAIEDIDAMTVNREEKMKNGKEINTVTLSTILSTLDGLFSPEGLIFVLTTNYPERLDSALIRKGRISIRKDFENANEYQTIEIFNRFFPSASQNYIDRFKSKGIGKPMCSLEAHLIEFSDNIEKAAQID